jgi:hypothetical protein
MAYLRQADIYFKMAGYDDRGFTLMKKLAISLCESDNQESVECGLKVYKELWP